MSFKRTVIIALTWLVSACASVSNNVDGQWPEHIPERAYFVAYYQADVNEQRAASLDRYLSWAKQFYLGSKFYKNGWLRVTETAVTSLDTEEEQQVIQERMAKLGKLISPEWSKTTKTRVIYTKHISIWGSGLLEAIENNEQIEYIDEVISDVKALLSREISPDDITSERYYATQFDEEDVFQ